jgi:putative transposase
MVERKEKLDRLHALPISRQCSVLDISRSSAYRKPSGVNAEDVALMHKFDALHLRIPFKGSRRLRDDDSLRVNRKRVQCLMRVIGIRAPYPGARSTRSDRQHKVYPYLLRDLESDRANPVWCADLTYIPMRKGFLYLGAIMDWHSRKVLS